jgi:hypothetical protein
MKATLLLLAILVLGCDCDTDPAATYGQIGN